MFNDLELRTLKRKIWLQTVLVTLTILFILLAMINSLALVAGHIFYNEFSVSHTRFNAKRFQPFQNTLADGIKNHHWQNISLKSRLGYTLQGTYLPSPTPSNNTVVIVPGIASSRMMGLRYAPMYWSAGYNILVYDPRASGDSGGKSVSWGFYERYDLDQWVDWLEQQHPQGIIGVHGISMGAATALLHAEMNEATRRVKFYVADSSFSDLEELLTLQIGAAVSPQNPLWVKILLRYSSIAANWQSGFRYQDVSPIRSVRQVTTPILYLHGADDALVPAYMSELLYDATNGYKEKYIFPGDAHTSAIFNHNAEYRQQVLRFIDTALKK